MSRSRGNGSEQLILRGRSALRALLRGIELGLEVTLAELGVPPEDRQPVQVSN